MPDTETLPAPVLEPLPPLDKWERERLAFRRLLPELLPTYRGRYVAIHEGQVVDSDEALIPLAMRVYNRHGYVPIYMDLVTDQPRQPERIPHCRAVPEPQA